MYSLSGRKETRDIFSGRGNVTVNPIRNDKIKYRPRVVIVQVVIWFFDTLNYFKIEKS